MKTTLEIPDPIFRQAKASAAERGIPLRQFVTDAVEEKLREPAASAEPAWMHLFGGLSDLRDETQQIDALIEEEFGQVDAKDWA